MGGTGVASVGVQTGLSVTAGHTYNGNAAWLPHFGEMPFSTKGRFREPAVHRSVNGVSAVLPHKTWPMPLRASPIPIAGVPGPNAIADTPDLNAIIMRSCRKSAASQLLP